MLSADSYVTGVICEGTFDGAGSSNVALPVMSTLFQSNPRLSISSRPRFVAIPEYLCYPLVTPSQSFSRF